MGDVHGIGRAVVADGRGMTRREAIAALGFTAGLPVILGGCTVPAPSPRPTPPPGGPDTGPFPDGVIAGDPRPDGALIWTRVEPPADGGPVPVVWMVGDGAELETVHAAGLATATAATGHCVKVSVAGLEANRRYHYRFEADGTMGRIGVLRTAPATGTTPDRLRFAVASCQQLNDSWFTAHRAIAAEPDLDFLVHLGDYVYASDDSTLTLDQYRELYRRWRRRPELRDLHQAIPVVAMWDDGEFFNGMDRLAPAERAAAAATAWIESFPVADRDGEVYRTVRWGDLADLPVIDMRSHADPYIGGLDTTAPPADGVDDPDRTVLGAEQFAWLTNELASSGAAWRLIQQGCPIHPWRLLNLEFLRPFRPDLPPGAGLIVPTDNWDRFITERRALFTAIEEAGVRDTVFCSGQTHIAMASELRVDPDDPASPVVGVDVVCPSLTADPDPRSAYLGGLPTAVAEEALHLAERWLLAQNAGNLRYTNLVDQGYLLVDVTPEAVHVTHRVVDTFDPTATATDGARFRIRRGTNRLEVLGAARGSVA